MDGSLVNKDPSSDGQDIVAPDSNTTLASLSTQITQPSSSDDLSSLFASFEALKHEFSNLKIENQQLKAQLTDIQQRLPNITTFAPFSRLPFELRLRIWGLALDVPHIISTLLDYLSESEEHFDVSIYNRTSPLMHACRESRLEALKSIRAFTYGVDYLRSGNHTAYWNPKVDIILTYEEHCPCDDPGTLDAVGQILTSFDETIEIHALAIPWWYFYESCQNSSLNNILITFWSMKAHMVYLVLGDKKLFRESDLMFVRPSGSLHEAFGQRHPDHKRCSASELESIEGLKLTDIDLPGKDGWKELEANITGPFQKIADEIKRNTELEKRFLHVARKAFNEHYDSEEPDWNSVPERQVPKFEFVVASTYSEQRRLKRR